MELTEDNDPAFWTGVVSHPALAHLLGGHEPSEIAGLAERGTCLRTEHGGYIFLPADSAGRAVEMHTAFTPEGWGREAFQALVDALNVMFTRVDLILTHETAHPQSRPPKTFRFAPMGEFHDTPHGQIRLWMLSREAWNAAPARRRTTPCLGL